MYQETIEAIEKAAVSKADLLKTRPLASFIHSMMAAPVNVVSFTGNLLGSMVVTYLGYISLMFANPNLVQAIAIKKIQEKDA